MLKIVPLPPDFVEWYNKYYPTGYSTPEYVERHMCKEVSIFEIDQRLTEWMDMERDKLNQNFTLYMHAKLTLAKEINS